MQEQWLNLHSTLNLGQITSWNFLRRLEADANLEASWAPINELNGSLSLKGCNRVMDILGDNISTIQQASSHILSVLWVTLDHLIVLLEAGHGNLLNRVLLVLGLGRRHYW